MSANLRYATTPQQFTNEREIMVNALQRSGHHAFITWLLRNCPQHLFLNAIQDDRFMRLRFIQNKPELRFVTDMGLSPERECDGDLTPKELIAYNTENFAIHEARRLFQSPSKARRIGSSRTAHFVIFLRDPFNNLASLAMRAPPDKLRETAHRWVDHYMAYRLALSGANSDVPVLYNRWLADPSYRRQVADRFQIGADGTPSETVRWGNGSSFGQTDHAPETMESRWRQVADEPKYRALFDDHAFRAAAVDFVDHYTSEQIETARNTLLPA